LISAQVAKHEKRLRDREMFREQAKLQRSQREAAHRAEALEEKREVDAAKKSLAEEAIKTEREKTQSKTEQERLRLEIIAERKLKEERKFAEWRENARIDAEARAHREAEESRRAKVKAKRDARIEKFASMHARGAGKQQADAAAADQARVDQYLAAQKRKDEARHFADLRKIADTNAKIKVAQPRDIPRRAPSKESFWCIFWCRPRTTARSPAAAATARRPPPRSRPKRKSTPKLDETRNARSRLNLGWRREKRRRAGNLDIRAGQGRGEAHGGHAGASARRGGDQGDRAAQEAARVPADSGGAGRPRLCGRRTFLEAASSRGIDAFASRSGAFPRRPSCATESSRSRSP